MQKPMIGMNIRKGPGLARKGVGWAIVGVLVWLSILPLVGILLYNLGWYD